MNGFARLRTDGALSVNFDDEDDVVSHSHSNDNDNDVIHSSKNLPFQSLIDLPISLQRELNVPSAKTRVARADYSTDVRASLQTWYGNNSTPNASSHSLQTPIPKDDEEEEARECTFRPSINDHSRTLASLTTAAESGEVFGRLYADTHRARRRQTETENADGAESTQKKRSPTRRLSPAARRELFARLAIPTKREEKKETGDDVRLNEEAEGVEEKGVTLQWPLPNAKIITWADLQRHNRLAAQLR